MGTRGVGGGGRARAGGVRRRATGGIEGDLLGELLADVLDNKTIRSVPAGPSTPNILNGIKARSFNTAGDAADRARQVLMRLRTVSRRDASGRGAIVGGQSAVRLAQRRLAVLSGMQVSSRQAETGRWVPIFAVSTRGTPILRRIMENSGVTPLATALGRGWFTIRR